MNLTATQTRILRDMADGAELTRMFYPSFRLKGDHCELKCAAVEESDVTALHGQGLIDCTIKGRTAVYAITPAGAVAGEKA